jgi:aminoglycoside phosphotransferase (APT) family kinase protein
VFLRKADIDIDNAILRDLADRNPREAVARIPIVADLVASTIGPCLEVTCFPVQGTFHLLHRAQLHSGKTLIVRSSLPDIIACDEGLFVEKMLFPLLESGNLQVPTIHAVSVGERDKAPFDFVIMDEARGQALQFMSEHQQDNPDIWHALGATLRRVHTIEGDGSGPLLPLTTAPKRRLKGAYSDWQTHLRSRSEAHVRGCCEAGLLAKNEAAEALRYLEDFHITSNSYSSLLHGDLGNHNIFVCDNRVIGLIDWEDALLGDPLFDIAMWTTFHPPRRYSAFLEGYGASARQAEFRLALSIYYLRITLAKAVVRLRFGYADRPGRPTIRDRLMNSLSSVRSALSGSPGPLFD